MQALTPWCRALQVVFRLVLTVSVGSGLLTAESSAAAQDPDERFARYSALVEAYRSGAPGAVAALAGWEPDDINHVVPQAAQRGGRFAQAAALMHFLVASDKAATDWMRGEGHLDTSVALVQSLPADAEAFTERYYALLPSLFLRHGDLDGARRWAERGLQLFEFSAPIRTSAGAIEEVLAHIADPECAGAGCPITGGRAIVPERLRLAERHYRTALQRDPSSMEARLRLGRVLALTGRDEEAISELTSVLTSESPRRRYLAHLFLGALAARRGDTATARGEYERAMEAGPGYQTPILALSYLEDSVGNVRRAHALIELLPSSAEADPWWSYQNGGLDEETLQWLVAYARQ